MSWDNSALVLSPNTYDDISSFAKSVFASLPRADQRRWAEVYLRGLLQVHKKKSIRNIVETISGDNATKQSLQQFVNQSPWDWKPVMSRVAEIIHQVITPRVWTVEHAVIPKRGDHSVGVSRRFVPAESRTVKSQLGVGIFVADEQCAVPISWRLSLPRHWLSDAGRRSNARIPSSLQPRSEIELVFDMLDEARAELAVPTLPPLMAGAKTRDAVVMADGLAKRSVEFALQLDDPDLPGVDELMSAVGRPSSIREAPGREGSGGKEPTRGASRSGREASHLTSSLVQIRSNGRQARLIREWRPGSRRPIRSWITNMRGPAITEILPLVSLRRLSAAAVSDMHEFGLHDFEGRSYPGWHHHMTLVSVAAAYTTLLKLAG